MSHFVILLLAATILQIYFKSGRKVNVTFFFFSGVTTANLLKLKKSLPRLNAVFCNSYF